MKITVAILTFALFHVAAIASYAQSAKVNLNVTNISVKEVLQKIEKISEYTFFVSDCSTTSCVFDFLLRCTPL